jgi:hypothetical protein
MQQSPDHTSPANSIPPTSPHNLPKTLINHPQRQRIHLTILQQRSPKRQPLLFQHLLTLQLPISRKRRTTIIHRYQLSNRTLQLLPRPSLKHQRQNLVRNHYHTSFTSKPSAPVVKIQTRNARLNNGASIITFQHITTLQASQQNHFYTVRAAHQRVVSVLLHHLAHVKTVSRAPHQVITASFFECELS